MAKGIIPNERGGDADDADDDDAAPDADDDPSCSWSEEISKADRTDAPVSLWQLSFSWNLLFWPLSSSDKAAEDDVSDGNM
jgi:hypothetical protein